MTKHTTSKDDLVKFLDGYLRSYEDIRTDLEALMRDPKKSTAGGVANWMRWHASQLTAAATKANLAQGVRASVELHDDLNTEFLKRLEQIALDNVLKQVVPGGEHTVSDDATRAFWVEVERLLLGRRKP